VLREDVLRKQEDFNNLRKHGKSFGSANVVLVVNKKEQALNRKAFLASKKVGNSVVRHRATRLMKESFRQIEKEQAIKQGFDLLFIARPNIVDLKCADVKKTIEAAMRRAQLFQ